MFIVKYDVKDAGSVCFPNVYTKTSTHKMSIFFRKIFNHRNKKTISHHIILTCYENPTVCILYGYSLEPSLYVLGMSQFLQDSTEPLYPRYCSGYMDILTMYAIYRH